MVLIKQSPPNTNLLTLLIVSVVSTLLLTVLITLVATNTTDSFDVAVLSWINAHASSALDAFFVIITQLGGVIVVTVVTLALVGYFIYKRDYLKSLLVAIGVGGATAIAFGLKALFERPRPDLWEWIVVETNFSFPSGHATASSALALCLVIIMWQTKWRYLVIVLASVYVILVGLSRLYLGVHYPTDIIGGWLLSVALVALVTATLYSYKLHKLRRCVLLVN